MCSTKATRCQDRPETLLPEQGNGVRRELRIVRHHGQTFLVRLGDEEAVERIPVVQGKAVQGIDMLEGDRQDPETVHHLLLLEQDAQWLGKCQLAELDLDLNFPAVHNAEPYVVAQIAESPIDCFRQTRRLVMPPQQSMGIKEQSHASPSQKASGSGLSKSSAMMIVPLPRPAIRFRGCCDISVSACSTSCRKCLATRLCTGSGNRAKRSTRDCTSWVMVDIPPLGGHNPQAASHS